MNKNELIKTVSEKTGFTKADSEKAIDAIVEIVKKTVADGESVKLVGFGSFEGKDRAAKIGRNPKTGQEVAIEAKRVPVFRAGKEFKEAVLS